MNLFAIIGVALAVFAFRVIAAVGGLVVGYFLSGPLLRVFWRIAFRRPIPPRLLPWAKSVVGVGLGLVVFVFFAPFNDNGGWGFGGPGGGGSGSGNGTGDGVGPSVDVKSLKSPGNKDAATSAAATREIVVIELIRSDRYAQDSKFYLLGRKYPPVALSAVEEALNKNPAKTELHLVFTADGIGRQHGAVVRLRDLAEKLAIPVLQKEE